jgi:hypothetical protein
MLAEETLRYAQGDSAAYRQGTAQPTVILSGAKNLSADVGKETRVENQATNGEPIPQRLPPGARPLTTAYLCLTNVFGIGICDAACSRWPFLS